MIRFDDPIYLWALVLIPVLALIRFYGWRKQRNRLRKFGDPELLRQLSPDVSQYRPTVKFWLMNAALAMLIIMMARPQMGYQTSKEKRNGIETIICMDISNSMLAQDVEPSRLDKSKMLVENLCDKFTNDKIGLIVFAGESYVQLPITSDYVSAKMFLENTTPDLIQTQGTDIGGAIRQAMNSFTQQQNIGKAIIVITDGEDHQGGAVEAAKAAHEKGFNVFILGIGEKGAPIPMADGSYLRDREGNVVMTHLNEDMCRKVAQAGSGKYIHVDNTTQAQEELNSDLEKLQKGEGEATVYSSYNEQFQAFGIIAILLLIIETCMLEAKNPRLRNIHLFRRSPRKAMIIALCMMAIGASAQNDRQLIRQGNRAFRNNQYAKSETLYRKAMAANQSNPQAIYNAGCALMGQKKYDDAITCFMKAAEVEKNPMRRSKAYHNLGWINQTQRNYRLAIQWYKQSLRLNPQDNETRYNLALCMHENDKNPDNNKKDNKKQNKDKDKKKQKKKKEQEKEQQQKQQQQQQQQPKMSRENAEQMLNAAVQQESRTKQRLQQAMRQGKKRELEQNW